MKTAGKVTTLILGGTLLLSACDTTVTENAPEFDVEDFFIYEELSRPFCFDVSEDGTIYAFCSSEPYEQEIGGTIYNVADTFLYSCTLDGGAKQLFKTEFSVNAVDCYNDELYCLVLNNTGGGLVSMNASTGETENVAELNEFVQFKSLEISDNTAYIVGISRERTGINGEYLDQFGNYRYNGEKLISINLENGEITESKVEYPVTASSYNDKIMVYAADKDGYFFSDFNGDNKNYNDLGGITGFEMYSNEGFIYSSDSLIGKLASAAFDAEDGTAEIIENIYCVNDMIKYRGGCTFVLSAGEQAGDEQIVRLKNSEYLKPSNKIKYISTEYNFESPFGCGYTMERTELDNESFSLMVLSQDKEYDICLINSKESVSENIRNKGSFYPLNEVPKVWEYLDKCYPYIKESAISADGGIWALPISVTTPIIMYNEATCASADITFSDNMSLSQLIDNAEAAFSSEYSNGYALQSYQLSQNIFLQYLAHNAHFDTSLFREMVQMLHDRANISVQSAIFPAYTAEMDNMFYGNSGGFLFSCLYNVTEQRSYADFCGDMHAVSIPNVNGSEKNAATCVYLAINPSSDNLPAALDYISSLCEYLGESRNSLVFSDKTTYTDSVFVNDLYGIYENSEICFNISSEIFFDDYQNYCSDGITLDEFIAEADRKLAAYLNE